MTNLYAGRRSALIAHMQANGGGVAIIPTAPEVRRNNDVEYPYRHDSHFYYLSGFAEPDAVMVLVAGAAPKSILFCRENVARLAPWHGVRHGPENACSSFGFDAAYPIAEMDQRLPALLSNAPALYVSFGREAEYDAKIHAWLGALRRQIRAGVAAPVVFYDVVALVSEMRLIKDDSEVASMRRAASISCEAHLRVMQCVRPGMTEYQVEAELLYHFRRHGADAPAFPAIVAAGANACVLHHNPGAAVLKDGDLLLIDAGCEFASYAADISRTFPVNGRFSAAQRDIYDIVLAAQLAAIAAVRPGNRYIDSHNAAVGVLAQGMLDTGLLDRNRHGSLDDVLASAAYEEFFMCRTGHWLGMDVHDVGDYREPVSASGAPTQDELPWRVLRPGMAMTIEPGLYIRPAPGIPEQYWNIGVRVEDDLLVTASGCDILSSGVPKTVADIECVMGR